MNSPLSASLLAPRRGEHAPYLMPAASASRGAAFDPFAAGMPTLYPRRIIWVDFDGGSDECGDGSRAAPLKTLDRVFGDPLLACVCSHLGADRIPVCCRGTLQAEHVHALTAPPPGLDSTVYDHALVGGTAHDYRRALEIMPWPGEARPRFMLKLYAAVRERQDAAVRASALLAVARGVRGCYWNRCDFIFEIYMGSDVEGQETALYAQLHGFDRCPGTAARDCTMTVAFPRGTGLEGWGSSAWTPPEPPGQPGDSSSSGDWEAGGNDGLPGHAGGSGGAGWWKPGAPSDSGYSYPYNAQLRIVHFHGCGGAFVAGGGGSWRNTAASNRSACVYSAAFDSCPGLSARDYTLTVPRTAAAVTGGGDIWRKADGTSGVAPFELRAEVCARIAGNCPDARLLNVSGALSALASCRATNRPHTTYADGSTVYHKIGGCAEAFAAAYPAESARRDCTADVTADACHPEGKAYITAAAVR